MNELQFLKNWFQNRTQEKCKRRWEISQMNKISLSARKNRSELLNSSLQDMWLNIFGVSAWGIRSLAVISVLLFIPLVALFINTFKTLNHKGIFLYGIKLISKHHRCLSSLQHLLLSIVKMKFPGAFLHTPRDKLHKCSTELSLMLNLINL